MKLLPARLLCTNLTAVQTRYRYFYTTLVSHGFFAICFIAISDSAAIVVRYSIEMMFSVFSLATLSDQLIFLYAITKIIHCRHTFLIKEPITNEPSHTYVEWVEKWFFNWLIQIDSIQQCRLVDIRLLPHFHFIFQRDTARERLTYVWLKRLVWYIKRGNQFLLVFTLWMIYQLICEGENKKWNKTLCTTHKRNALFSLLILFVQWRHEKSMTC